MTALRTKLARPRIKLAKDSDTKKKGSVELVGDWSLQQKPPAVSGKVRAIRIGGDFLATDLECLKLFSGVQKLNIFSYRILDFSEIEALKGLNELCITARSPRSRLNLDFSRLPNLKRLSVSWDSSITNQGMLKRLTHLFIRGCSGVKHLDLSGLSSLEHLSIGPAKGVESIDLSGIPKLKRLSLSLMSRLKDVEGSEFYDTVSILSIPGTKQIPASFLASFSALEAVDVGTKSVFSKASFTRCAPTVIGLPV